MIYPDVPVSVGWFSVFLSAVRTLEPRLFSALMPIMCQHVTLLAEGAIALRTEVTLLLLDYSTTPTKYWKKKKKKQIEIEISESIRNWEICRSAQLTQKLEKNFRFKKESRNFSLLILTWCNMISSTFVTKFYLTELNRNFLTFYQNIK